MRQNNVWRAANSSISQGRSEVGAGTARLLQSMGNRETTCGGQRTAQFLNAVRRWERARPACFSLQKNASEQRAAGSEQLNFSRPFGGGGGHSPPAFVYGKSRNNVRRAANSSISQDRSEVGAGTARLLQSTEKCVRTTCGGQRTAQFLKAVRRWERARPAPPCSAGDAAFWAASADRAGTARGRCQSAPHRPDRRAGASPACPRERA